MCFSATVSFTSSAVLIPLGAWTLHRVLRTVPRLWPLAVVSIIFGIQQACEGLVWLALQHQLPRLLRGATLAYLFFALAFWPLWFSFAARWIDSSPGHRTFLTFWVFLSTAWFWIIYLPLLLQPSRAHAWVVAHSIHYPYADDAAEWGFPGALTILQLLYVLTASIPLLVSSFRRMLLLPIGAGVVSAFAAAFLYRHAFTSVWCLVAAVLSLTLVRALHLAAEDTSFSIRDLKAPGLPSPLPFAEPATCSPEPPADSLPTIS